MQGRLFQLWQCVRDQTEQIEKNGPLHILFLFIYFFLLFFCYFFARFCVDVGHFFLFFYVFYVFFMFTNFAIPDIERRKRKRNLLTGQPQGSLSESIDTAVFICFDLKLLFLVACLLED